MQRDKAPSSIQPKQATMSTAKNNLHRSNAMRKRANPYLNPLPPLLSQTTSLPVTYRTPSLWVPPNLERRNAARTELQPQERRALAETVIIPHVRSSQSLPAEQPTTTNTTLSRGPPSPPLLRYSEDERARSTPPPPYSPPRGPGFILFPFDERENRGARVLEREDLAIRSRFLFWRRRE